MVLKAFCCCPVLDTHTNTHSHTPAHRRKLKTDCLVQTYKLRGTFKTLVVAGRHRSLDVSADWTAGHHTHTCTTYMTENNTALTLYC